MIPVHLLGDNFSNHAWYEKYIIIANLMGTEKQHPAKEHVQGTVCFHIIEPLLSVLLLYLLSQDTFTVAIEAHEEKAPSGRKNVASGLN